MPADDVRLDEVYGLCEEAGRPVVIHAGRAPSSPGYGVDKNALWGGWLTYARLLSRYENLYLGTTMSIAGFLFPGMASRLLYGTDFPNIPYAWDRELGMAEEDKAGFFYQTAERLFGG